MKLNKVILIFVLLFSLVSIATAAPPFEIQGVSADIISLEIVYPKESSYPAHTQITFPFDVLDNNYTKVDNTVTSCTYNVVDNTGGGVASGSLTYSSSLLYWHFNLSSTTDEGKYNYYVYCNSTTTSLNGFLSSNFAVTHSGVYLDDIAFIGIAIILIAILSFYFYLAVNWHFKLFSRQGDEKDSVIKAFIILIAIWLLTVPIQYAIEVAQSTLLSDMITLLELLYQVQIWFNWFITIYMVIYLLFNLFLYMTKQSETGGAGRLLKK